MKGTMILLSPIGPNFFLVFTGDLANMARNHPDLRKNFTETLSLEGLGRACGYITYNLRVRQLAAGPRPYANPQIFLTPFSQKVWSHFRKKFGFFWEKSLARLRVGVSAGYKSTPPPSPPRGI